MSKLRTLQEVLKQLYDWAQGNEFVRAAIISSLRAIIMDARLFHYSERYLTKTVEDSPQLGLRGMRSRSYSKNGAQTQAILMALFQTARLQNLNSIQTIMEKAEEAILRKDFPREPSKNAA